MNWPFKDWHRLAVQNLQLSPSEFWAMPLADWLSLIEPTGQALDRASLNQLMKDYPDDEHKNSGPSTGGL